MITLDYQRYHLKNPREFFITALRKGFKPNKSSERYSKLQSINEFKPKLTQDLRKSAFKTPYVGVNGIRTH